MLSFLFAAGCAEYSTPDEACTDHVAGSAGATDAAIELFGRISCYRRFVHLDRANINPLITDAVESHAHYLETNDVLSEQNPEWQSEVFGEFGFTGFTAYDRLVDSKYLVQDFGPGVFVWEVLAYIDPNQTYTEQVDELMDDPFFRDVFLAPSWDGSGYAEFTAGYPAADSRWAYMNVVLYHPSGAHSTRPVVYPADGQIDVPPSWANPYSFDPQLASLPEVLGYPITFTLGSNQLSGNLGNPLEVEVVASSIVSASGEVEHEVVLPANYAVGTNWSTAALMPLVPLVPNTAYTVTVELSWIERQNHVVTTTFTTGVGR